MFGNGNGMPKIDRRIRRTRDRLGDAMVALLHEKSFDTITVQDVLDRAGVGRSTFYTHFRDKDDLFLSDVDEFFEHMSRVLSSRGDKSNRLFPVRELFAHIGESRTFYQALVSSGRFHEVLGIAQEQFARGIAARLGDIPPAQAIPADQRTPIAHALAGALLSMQTWWIDRGMPETPERMDEMYHRLAWEGISARSLS